ncbi:hypothetical protein L3Q82_011464 [Scortum barcoo]|uniref:Uncharacterized protein n=1 Tax=Scortum barcoo TaxID=214431 RepID=A0ACB8W9W4_9TELE|nr:hypothetical protein L3Q82_011464 [Scortum barcoo]
MASSRQRSGNKTGEDAGLYIHKVVEGQSPLPLGSAARRKRLRSAGEDGEEARSCASRPNPEGSLSAGELSRYGKPEEEEEELQRLCQRCHIMTSQLNRQAAALTDAAALKVWYGNSTAAGPQTPTESGENGREDRPGAAALSAGHLPPQSPQESLQHHQRPLPPPAHTPQSSALWQEDPAYASFLFDKLQRLQWPRRGRHASVDARCDFCGASFHHLRRLALRRALGVSREMAPRPAAPGVHPPTAASMRPASESSWADELPVKQQRWSYEEQQGGGAMWGWGGVQSTYLCGGGAKRLATVTPLPPNAEHYLEGVWRVSCCRPEHQKTMVGREGQTRKSVSLY